MIAWVVETGSPVRVAIRSQPIAPIKTAIGKVSDRACGLIAKHIQSTTDDVLRPEHGSLYPALHRLERQGWVAAKWELLGERKRECKYYRLTPAGQKQLAAEESNWNRVAKAIARVMRVPVKV